MTNTDATHRTSRGSRHVQCLDTRGLHRMAYWEWGDRGATTACWSARTACRARAATSTCSRGRCRASYRVVCPDVVGRGESDRLADPMGYALPTYVADMVTLLARLDAKSVALGRHLDGRPDRHGPGGAARLADRAAWCSTTSARRSTRPALARIGGYLGQPLTWASEDEAADYLLTISQGFGPHTREEWLALTRPMLRRDGERLRLHYDPAIAVPLRAFTPELAAAGEAALWAAYDRDPLPDAAAARRRLRPAVARRRPRR